MEQKSYYALYRAIGYLGILLIPLDIWKCGWVIPPSTSQSYYLGAIVPFVVIIGSMGIIFFFNLGFDWRDEICNKISGLAAIGVISFPCESPKVLLGLIPYPTMHYASAILLFSTFAFMCFFVFTRYRSTGSDRLKAIRNRVYVTCGFGIVVGMVCFIILKGKTHISWSEYLMIVSFVIAYLVQGGVALKENSLISVAVKTLK